MTESSSAMDKVMDGNMERFLDQSDLSDPEDAEKIDLTPLDIDWLDLEFAGCSQKLGISSLPGCRFQKEWRSLLFDISCLKAVGVDDVFCLCTKGELYKYRVPNLIEKYTESGLTVHHWPVDDGQVPDLETLMKLVEEIRLVLLSGKKTLLHCYGGFGRSCAVAACLMMVMDENTDNEEAARRLKDLKGEKAIQSVKQYNFVNDFQALLKKYREANKGSDSRSISR